MRAMHYVFRRMVRSSGLSVMVVLSIALAVGLNFGTFAVTQSALIHSLGVPDEGRLVHYTLVNGEHRFAFSGVDYQALRELVAFKDVMAWKSDRFRIQEGGGVRRISGALVTGNAFAILNLRPSLGRLLNDTDDAPGGGKGGWAAVLDYSFWKTHFDARSDVIGQYITVNGVPVRIVGVLPRQFSGLVPLMPANILLPRYFQTVSDLGEHRFAHPYYFEWIVLGRLTQGHSLQSVQANLKAVEPIFRQLADPDNLFSDTPPGVLLNVEAGTAGLALSLKALRPPLLAIEVLAASIFFFCLFNVILLFWARASRDEHATAIRRALGAQLADELRFAITEAITLTAMGCFVAVPIAFITARILSRVVQSIHGFQNFQTVSPSLSLLLVAVFSTAVCVCLAVAVACIRSEKGRKYISLREGRASTVRHSRNWVVGLEVFACVILITVAVLDIAGFRQLARQPSGFGVGNAVMVSLDLTSYSSAKAAKPEGASDKERLSRILTFIKDSPGVQSVGAINVLPLTNSSAIGTADIRGPGGRIQKFQVWPAEVSVGYFTSSGTQIIRGRDFAKDDLAGDPICILSSRAASILFPGVNPIQEYLHIDSSAPCRVVGIAENAHFKSMSDQADAIVYRLGKNELMNVVVRATTSALAIQAIRSAMKSVAPDALPSHIETIQTYIQDDLRKWKIVMLSGAFCAFVAATILCIGFFGILSLQVEERKRDIGIQIALGANRFQLCLAVLKKICNPLVLGLALGSPVSLFAAVRLEQIYALNARAVIEGYCFSLGLIALLMIAASAVPLHRALAVSPMECLTGE